MHQHQHQQHYHQRHHHQRAITTSATTTSATSATTTAAAAAPACLRSALLGARRRQTGRRIRLFTRAAEPPLHAFAQLLERYVEHRHQKDPDRACGQHAAELEKIKTIGDAYIVVAGAPKRRRDHAEAIAAMSLEIKDSFAKLAKAGQYPLDFRIGIHSGPVVAGVIGKKTFSYDMWGDSVNTAARMEAHGIPGEIQVSAHFQDLLKDMFLFVERGLVDIKGKGELLSVEGARHVGNRLVNRDLLPS